MHQAQVEIYSDETNKAVLRHPDRRFPGILVQGDHLYQMCQTADAACASAANSLKVEDRAELNTLRNALWGYLTHYKIVLGEHGIELPFSEYS